MQQTTSTIPFSGIVNGLDGARSSYSETALLADMVSQILAARPVPPDQLSALISGIGRIIVDLKRGRSDTAADTQLTEAADPPAVRRKITARTASSAGRSAVERRPPANEGESRTGFESGGAVSSTEVAGVLARTLPEPGLTIDATSIAEPSTRSAKPAEPVVTRLATRGRGRPRAAASAVASLPAALAVPQPEPAVEPQSPRLLRRSEVDAAPSAANAVSAGLGLLARPTSEETVHSGIVRWFDPKKQVGALRISGHAEGVAIDSEILRKAGIVRLYKGQEIEARVRTEGAEIRLVSLTVAGASSATERAEGLFGPRRQVRSPVVELKRDALRKTAARLEAEQLFARRSPARQGGSSSDK